MGTHDDDLARLDKATAKVKRARTALRDAETEARRVVGEALKSAVTEGRSRTEVQRRSPFSPPVVRAIGEDAGVVPDERYVRAPKTTPAAPAVRGPEVWPEATASVRPLSVPSEDELPADIRSIHPGLAAEIVDKIRRGFPTWHDENRDMVASAPPLFQNLLEIKRARDAGILDDLGIVLP
jgi:hypothetical protein